MTPKLLLGLMLLLLLASCGQGSRDEAGAPATPSGLEIQIGDEWLTLTWNPNSEDDLKGYNIYWRAEGELAATEETMFVAAPATSATISDLVNGTTYLVAIDAENDAGRRSARTSEQSVTPQARYQMQANYVRGIVSVVLQHKLTAVTTATITANGTALEHVENGKYEASIPLSEGETLELHVLLGNVTLTASGIMPAAVALDAPASGTAFAPEDTILVQWASTTDPDRFLLGVSWPSGETTASQRFDVAGNARTFELPANEVALDQPVTLNLHAINDGTISGSLAAESHLRLRAVSGNVTVFVTDGSSTPPATPTGLAAVAGDEEVTLTWNANSETDVRGYNIYWGSASGDLNETVFIAAPSTTTTVSGLDNGTTYYFAISAEDWSGNKSPRSSEVGALPMSHYAILGGDMGALHQNVWVFRRAVGVMDATVTVNGTALAHMDRGRYYGVLSSALAEGDAITVEVAVGTDTVTGTDVIPHRPSVTGPADGSSFSSSDTIPVAWDVAVSAQRYVIWACWNSMRNCRTYAVADGEARSHAIPAYELEAGPAVTIDVYAYNDGTFSGPYLPTSQMRIRAESDPTTVPTITITP